MTALYTIFGKTRMVPVHVILNGAEIQSDKWDEELWVERGEDEYAMRNDRLYRVIYREEWIRAKDIATP